MEKNKKVCLIKFVFTILLSVVFANSLIAQTILRIDDESVSVEDFKAMYDKNMSLEKNSVSDYMDLFVVFKLKVKEAENLGLDKEASFINEFNGYCNQLAAPYLVDETIKDNLIEEAYEHMKYDLRASHILIMVDADAKPADTLAAWNKIMQIREKAINGESFGDLAYKYSDDPSARERDAYGMKYPPNYGDLGYFTSFIMIYNFEKAAYNTPVGEISMPIRTNFGYHIIKVTDKIPAMGTCVASHIIFRIPEKTPADSAKALEKAQKAYERIMAGEDFAEVAKEVTEDPSSKETGGRLKSFLPFQMEPNFIKSLSKVEEGGVTQPFVSAYGVHIAKLHSKSGIKSFEEEKPEIIKKINQSDRLAIENKILVDKLKDEYNFKQYDENYYDFVEEIVENYHSLKDVEASEDKPLFTYDGKQKTQLDFLKYLVDLKINPKEKASSLAIFKYYNNYVDEVLKQNERENLENKYPEFRRLVQEYHDGILLYNINEQEIWNKAIQDTVGLKNYYKNNIYKYRWPVRADYTKIEITDPSYAKRTHKMLRDKRKDFDDIIDEINSKSKDTKILNVVRDTVDLENDPLMSFVGYNLGLSNIINYDGKNYILKVHKIIQPTDKKFEECKGLVLADYQNYLDEKWVRELKNKYHIIINREELDKLEKLYD
ncbi:MAG: peptidylprolyl isomerase [Bacteroidales bacterium]